MLDQKELSYSKLIFPKVCSSSHVFFKLFDYSKKYSMIKKYNKTLLSGYESTPKKQLVDVLHVIG